MKKFFNYFFIILESVVAIIILLQLFTGKGHIMDYIFLAGDIILLISDVSRNKKKETE